MKKNAMILSLIFIIFTSSCGNKIKPVSADPTPVARIGDEVVTHGFLDYAMKKMSLDPENEKLAAAVLSDIITNILLAHFAEIEGIHKQVDFTSRIDRTLFEPQKKFLCEVYSPGEPCGPALFENIKKRYQIRIPVFSWDTICIRAVRRHIELGGTIPASRDLPETGRIDQKEASQIVIRSKSSSITLNELINQLSDQERSALIYADIAEKKMFLENRIIAHHINFIANDLDSGRRELLSEIALRTRQNLLADIAREKIGFQVIGTRWSGTVKYAITANESRTFYNKHRQLFMEPQWVEASHIRVSDYFRAERLRKELIKDPSSFCKRAGELSTAPDSKNCGYMGKIWRIQGEKLPLYKSMDFTLSQEGELSQPFLTPEGTEILKLLKRGMRQLAFEDQHTRDLIAEKMQPVKREERLAEIRKEMKKRFPVKSQYLLQ
jgi:hypothetical protein